MPLTEKDLISNHYYDDSMTTSNYGTSDRNLAEIFRQRSQQDNRRSGGVPPLIQPNELTYSGRMQESFRDSNTSLSLPTQPIQSHVQSLQDMNAINRRYLKINNYTLT